MGIDPRHRPADGGFTVIEVMVAITVVAIVMSASLAVFVRSISVTGQQSGRQTAIQVANSAMERVAAIPGPALVTGRAQAAVDAQWASPVAGVAPFLAGMVKAYDTTVPLPAAPLPTTPEQAVVNGVTYLQHWYVGTCRVPKTGGDCTGTVANPSNIGMVRVVVAVTWPDRSCAGTCSYVSSTFASGGTGEPLFNTNQSGNQLTAEDPGDQIGERTVPVSLQLRATGGVTPYTWTGTGLPPGLTVASGGTLSGTPTTAGTYSVTVTARDAGAATDVVTFTFTVNALPQITAPGDQTSAGGTSVSLQLGHTGGTAPLRWSATGLPAGLKIDSETGKITGKPTATQPATPVTVTLTDRYDKSHTRTFTWTIPALAIETPGAQAGVVGTAVTPLSITVTGGVVPYSWSASGLPPGLSVTDGVVSGVPTTAGTYQVTVTVTDKAGASRSTASFTWGIQ